MTTLNFALSRVAGRDFESGDEILVTRLDHDANVAPWLELARDRDLRVGFVDIYEEDCTLGLLDLERQLSDRTRVVAFPWASNAVGTVTDVRRIADLAHEAGALAWIDAVHYAPHGPIDWAPCALTSSSARRTSSSARTWVSSSAGKPFSSGSVRTRCGPLTTTRSRTVSRPVPCRTRRSQGSWQPSITSSRSAGRRSRLTSESSESASSLAYPKEFGSMDFRPWAAGRRPSQSRSSRTPRTPSRRTSPSRTSPSGRGNYYALEIMERLGLPDGAVRIGFVHYNTVEEVDRLLGELGRMAR